MDELLSAVESLKSMLVARATGTMEGSQDYGVLRRRLLSNGLLKGRLPQLVSSCRNLDEFWAHIKEVDGTYAGRRKYLAEQFDDVLSYLEASSESPADTVTSLTVEKFDSARVTELWMKALQRRDVDPEGAITAARSLVETVCKHILDSLGEVHSPSDDLPKLYKTAANALNLGPSQHTEQQFKQILSGCQTVVYGLGSLRNALGDAHGPGKVFAKPAPRHAELAVNIAGTMASFLIATYEAQGSKSSQ